MNGKRQNRIVPNLYCVTALLVGYSAILVSAQPVVETSLEPKDGFAVGVPFQLVIAVTWKGDSPPTGLFLSERPNPDGVCFDAMVGKTIGRDRLEMRLTYIPEREGEFDLEPIVLTYKDPELGDQAIHGLSPHLKVGPAPLPWWQGPKVIGAAIVVLVIVVSGSMLAAILRARNKNKTPVVSETSTPNVRVSTDDLLLDVKRKRLEGDWPGFAAALDKTLVRAVLERPGRPASLGGRQVRLADLLSEIPEEMRGRLGKLAGFCDELRYAKPVVTPQELDGIVEEAKWLIERFREPMLHKSKPA